MIDETPLPPGTLLPAVALGTKIPFAVLNPVA